MRVLGTAIATESAKKVGESVYREAKKAVRQPAAKKAIARAAKDVGVPLAKATLIGAAVAGTLAAGGAALTKNRTKQARSWADAQLKATRKKLPNLSADQAKVLWQQYYDHALKAPVQNTFSGK